MKKIVITIPLKGLSTGDRTISVKAEGYSGNVCANATNIFAQATGRTLATNLDGAYYESPERELEREN